MLPTGTAPDSSSLIGILPGEGCGPELVESCARILAAVEGKTGHRFEIRRGGDIGCISQAQGRGHLPGDVITFCRAIFEDGGAILAGAGGGRFVYDLRRVFRLYYKLNPVRTFDELAASGRLRPQAAPVDILIVRENLDGLYQGESRQVETASGLEVHHQFALRESSTRAVLEVALRAAADRMNRLAVVCKASGLPGLHALWKNCAESAAAGSGVTLDIFDIDYAVYKLVQDPLDFDVIVAPNCFGDILADLGGVIMGSRGLTYGASYSGGGAAVYQTNHGAAYDLAGTDRVNPAGQILALAMMLRESFGLADAALSIESALRSVWARGWRSEDIPGDRTRVARASEIVEAVIGGIGAAT